MTDDERFAPIRIAITLFVTLAIWSLLGWQSFRRGVPAHHSEVLPPPRVPFECAGSGFRFRKSIRILARLGA